MARRNRLLALAEEEREKREALKASYLATMTPEERAEYDKRQEEARLEQEKRMTEQFWESARRQYRSRRGSH